MTRKILLISVILAGYFPAGVVASEDEVTAALQRCRVEVLRAEEKMQAQQSRNATARTRGMLQEMKQLLLGACDAGYTTCRRQPDSEACQAFLSGKP